MPSSCRLKPSSAPARPQRSQAVSSSTPSSSATVKILNRLGLHARPAMAFVDIANGFRSDIRVQKGQQIVDGKSIMQMMMLAATEGTELEIHAQGDDAADAITALKALIDRKFDED